MNVKLVSVFVCVCIRCVTKCTCVHATHSQRLRCSAMATATAMTAAAAAATTIVCAKFMQMLELLFECGYAVERYGLHTRRILRY